MTEPSPSPGASPDPGPDPDVSHVIGLDIGDGESALAWLNTQDEDAGPARIYSRPSTAETTVLTAFAREPDGDGCLLGEEALLRAEAVQFTVNFKEAPEPGKLTTPRAVLFAHALLDEFFTHHPEVRDDHALFVGHPAGWSAAQVGAYRDHLRQPGMSPRLLAESQSALVHARDRRRDDPRPLDKVLVVDIGSSTVDVVVVEDLIPRNLPVGADLGARQIDDELAGMVERALAGNREFQAALSRDSVRDFLRVVCRRAKEAQFSGARQDILSAKLAHRADLAPVVVDAFGWLKTQEIPHLVTRPGGWADRFEQLLTQVRELLPEPPQLVVLTGGGSRMPFTRQICERIFPGAETVPDRDPSLSVARGLASAGRQRVRVARFRRDVNAIAASAELDAFVREQTEIAHQKLKQSIVTALRSQDQATWAAAIRNPPDQAQIVADMQASVSDHLAPRVEQVCVRYGIGNARFSSRLTLPPAFAAQIVDELLARTQVSGLDPAQLGFLVTRLAKGIGWRKIMRPRLAGRPDPATLAAAAALLAISLAPKGLELYRKKQLLDYIQGATMPADGTAQLLAETLAELSSEMERRAEQVERFVR